MLQKKIKKWSTYLIARINRKRIIAEIKKTNSNPYVTRLIRVYETQLENGFNKDESSYLEKNDQIRSELLNSNEVIRFKKIWEQNKSFELAAEDSISVGDLASSASIPAKWGEFLFRIVREFQPYLCLELGTNLGISASYLATALDLNKKGLLVTLEGNPAFANIAKEKLNKFGMQNAKVVPGLFEDTLEDTLKSHKSFDFVFIDGHHDMDATISYFEKIMPYLSSNSIVVFDDIHWSDGMLVAWKKIIEKQQIVASFDFYKLGVVIFDPTNRPEFDVSGQYQLALYL